MQTSISDYEQYKNICLLAAKNNNYFETFKSNPNYIGILEHVSEELGKQYYNHCLTVNKQQFNEKNIKILKKIDSLGSPIRYHYDGVGFISPTILRYFSVLGDIERLYGSLNNKTIVEIGAGYGGQSMLINSLYKIKKYIIIDLPETIELIKTFLKKNNINLKLYEFYSYPNIPKIKSDFVISNYAFSECYKPIQDVYIDNIINDCKNFYMIMNFLNNNVYSKEELIHKLTGEIIVTKEIPCSSPNNLLFYR